VSKPSGAAIAVAVCQRAGRARSYPCIVRASSHAGRRTMLIVLAIGGSEPLTAERLLAKVREAAQR
jgi:hypothetical protein